MSLILGIDGGGTKTAAVLIDETGRVLAKATTGATNHLAAFDGAAEVRMKLAELSREVLGRAGLAGQKVDLAYLALAGVGLAPQYSRFARLFEGVIPAREVCLENDAVAGLVGATLKLWGVVVAAGTGSIAVGINPQGERRRSGGWGHLLGDEGSGYWIAWQGLNQAARFFDGRQEETTLLVEYALEFFKVTSFDEVIRVIYNLPFRKEELAAFAPCVTMAARRGDLVALAILKQAGIELGKIGKAVILQLGLENAEFDLALTGGVFAAGELVIGPLREQVMADYPWVRISPPQFPPVIGAAILGLWRINVVLDDRIITRLRQGLA